MWLLFMAVVDLIQGTPSIENFQTQSLINLCEDSSFSFACEWLGEMEVVCTHALYISRKDMIIYTFLFKRNCVLLFHVCSPQLFSCES